MSRVTTLFLGALMIVFTSQVAFGVQNVIRHPILAGGKMSVLTTGECKGLGCTVIKDPTCPTVGGKSQRCSCYTGGSACINKKK
jgi:hypothetical protein